MTWEEVISEKSQVYGFEACKVTAAGRLYLIFPKQPTKEVEKELRAIIPETEPYEILVRTRMQTEMMVMVVAKMGGAIECPEFKTEDNKVTIELKAEGEGCPLLDKESGIWDPIVKVLRTDKYVEAYEIKVNGEVMAAWDGKAEKAAAEKAAMEAKAVACDSTSREKPITNDDMMDLKINLGKSQDVNDFINSL